MYLHCTAYTKKKYQLRTDISSIEPADDKHALDPVVMVLGPSLIKKTDTEIYGLFNEVMKKSGHLASSWKMIISIQQFCKGAEGSIRYLTFSWNY
jgi:hypothetical protein